MSHQNKLVVLSVLMIIFGWIVPSEQLDPKYCQCRRQSKARIVGGKEIQNESIPWLVSLGKRPDNPYENNPYMAHMSEYLKKQAFMYKLGIHSCGGLIVNENWILTSAHCTLKHPSKLAVSYGHNQDLIAMFDSGRIVVEKIVVHPNFTENVNKKTYTNDLALVKMSSPLPIDGENVSAACLKFDPPSEGESLFTMFGWGATAPPSVVKGFLDYQPNSQFLRELTLLDSTETEEFCSDRDDIMCANTYGEDAWNQGACKGDDGSPVHQNIQGKLVVTGVQSYSSVQQMNGETKFCVGTMAITKLSQMKKWIQSVIGTAMCTC